MVLAVRGVSVTTDTALPIYEQNLLGGAANLRGYEAGYKAGDNLAAASAELRIPITSPLNIGRFGVKAFVDWGTIYAVGDKLSDQAFERGIGGGAYLHLTIVSLSLDVARSRHRQHPVPLRHGSHFQITNDKRTKRGFFCYLFFVIRYSLARRVP